MIKPKVGWFQRVDMETGEILDKNYRMADTYEFSFWHPILQCKKFNEFIEKKYAVAAGSIMQSEDVIEDLDLDEDD